MSDDPFAPVRGEIDAAQKARDELLKWKAVSIATLAGAGLGFAGASGTSSPLVLAVLPFACAYIDLLCRNLSIRSKSASRFMELIADAGDRSAAARYEQFYARFASSRGPALESFALIGSSVLVAIASAPVGILASGSKLWSADWHSALFYSASALGLLVSLGCEVSYWLQLRALTGTMLQPGEQTDATVASTVSP